jgi:hypothetical protein
MICHSASTIAWYSYEKASQRPWSSYPQVPNTYRHLVYSDLSVVFLCFQFQLNVQAQDFGVNETLGLLLESGIRESLLECYTLDQQGVLFRAESVCYFLHLTIENAYLHSTSRHLLYTDQTLVQIFLVEAHDGINNHSREEGFLGVNEFRGH